MDLIKPDLGLIFWTGLVFLTLMLLLSKFAWKPFIALLDKREANIQEALDMAKNTKAEMEQLKTQNENLLKEARIERDEIIKEAKATSNDMIAQAKNKAKEEADKLIAASKLAFETEKNAAIAELKNQVAAISIEIAEKILKDELTSKKKQTKLAEGFVQDINLN